jgi:hypothetical protein
MRSESVAWSEIEHAVPDIFKVWWSGGEHEWAKEAWDHLGQSGLTDASTILEYTKVYLRLVTLGRIYEEFSGIAWDENPETPVDYMAENLGIDPIALGILAATDDLSADTSSSSTDLREAALIAATDKLRFEIFNCLKSAYGSAEAIYSRMWHTMNNDWSDDENERNFEEFEVTQRNAAALNFVQNGFRR